MGNMELVKRLILGLARAVYKAGFRDHPKDITHRPKSVEGGRERSRSQQERILKVFFFNWSAPISAADA
jgi:hypothetical protein